MGYYDDFIPKEELFVGHALFNKQVRVARYIGYRNGQKAYSCFFPTWILNIMKDSGYYGVPDFRGYLNAGPGDESHWFRKTPLSSYSFGPKKRPSIIQVKISGNSQLAPSFLVEEMDRGNCVMIKEDGEYIWLTTEMGLETMRARENVLNGRQASTLNWINLISTPFNRKKQNKVNEPSYSRKTYVCKEERLKQ